MRFRIPFSRFIVSGESMEPSFIAGDRVLVHKRCMLQQGDVIVFEHNGIKQLKRIGHVSLHGFFLLGDNAGKSRDSRHFGHIVRDQILGKVVLKY